MKFGFVLSLWFLFALPASLFTLGATEMPPQLSADEVMMKAVERAQHAERELRRPDYLFSKLSISEELDDRGRVKERKE